MISSGVDRAAPSLFPCRWQWVVPHYQESNRICLLSSGLLQTATGQEDFPSPSLRTSSYAPELCLIFLDDQLKYPLSSSPYCIMSE
jgi:hypothetical protein